MANIEPFNEAAFNEFIGFGFGEVLIESQANDTVHATVLQKFQFLPKSR
jgi:hypothetical protein